MKPKEEPKYTISNLDNDKYKDYSVLKEVPKQERMYSEEDLRAAISIAYSKGLAKPNSGRLSDIPNVQNDILQSLSQSKTLISSQTKRMYSEEEVIVLLQKYRLDLSSGKTPNLGDTTKQWLEQFRKKII